MATEPLGILMDRINLGGSGFGVSEEEAAGRSAEYRGWPGVSDVQVWTAVESGTGCLVTCELNNLALGSMRDRSEPGDGTPAALEGGRWFIGEQIFPCGLHGVPEAGGLLTVYMDPIPGAEGEFEDWYNTEHIPRLSAIPGVLTARRFRARSGRPGFLAVYQLTLPEICTSRAWAEAAFTPWRTRIAWLTQERQRILYRRQGNS